MTKPRNSSRLSVLTEGDITKRSRMASSHLAFVLSDAAFIVKCYEFVDDGLRGVDYSKVNRGGSEGSAPELAAIAGRADTAADQLYEFAILLERVARDSKKLDDLRKKLRVDWNAKDSNGKARSEMASDIADRDNAPKGSGYCSNCTRVVSGSTLDRIVSGRCGECYRYWVRHGRAEDRPRSWWDSGQCKAEKWSAGVDYECMLPEGHPMEHEADHQWRSVCEAS